ncbi:unnamed protein product [Alopecurus aequalis]
MKEEEKEKAPPHPHAHGAAAAPPPRTRLGDEHGSASVYHVGALEKAIAGFAQRETEAMVNPTVGSFSVSLDEAYEFYNIYSWESGFGVRYGASSMDSHGTKCIQQFVCACEGNQGQQFISSDNNVPHIAYIEAKNTLCDDLKKTVETFARIKAKDPTFDYTGLQVDSNCRIRPLLWTSGQSLQYQYFGDVIIFDTTYRSDKYGTPFGLFVGVNRKFGTILLGGVLMIDEKMESFKWVLSQFFQLMGGKHPQTILTGRCEAIEEAVLEYEKLWSDQELDYGFQEKRTTMGEIVLRTNLPIEKHASEVYKLFVQAIRESEPYMVESVIPNLRYIARHPSSEPREKWSRVEYEVNVTEDGEAFMRVCKQFEHTGMLCCHAVKVMIHLDVREIPSLHVMPRWTTKPLQCQMHCGGEPQTDTCQQCRNSVLHDKFLYLAHHACEDERYYEVYVKGLDKLDRELAAAKAVPGRRTKPASQKPRRKG